MNLYKSNTYINELKEIVNSGIDLSKINNSTFLITGATGLVGSGLVDFLLIYNQTHNANIKVYACGRNIERLKGRFINDSNLVFIEWDVNDLPKFDYQFDYIIHAASNSYPAAFNQDPVGTITTNIIGLKNLLDYGTNHNCKRLLYVSSGEVYGIGNESLDSFDEDYCGTIDSTNPRSCYPNSKRTAETLCVSYSKQYSLDTIIVRPCHLYGPNFTNKDNRVSAQFFLDVLENRNIVMKSEGLQKRSYCYIMDAINALLCVLINGESNNAYNIANPNSITTIADFALEIARVSNKEVVFDNPSKSDIEQRTFIEKQVLDTKKIENIGYIPVYNLHEGIKNTYQILKEAKETHEY